MPPRRVTAVEFEGALAQLAVAGIRQILQATVTAAPGASTPYTIQNTRTRRVLCIHLNSGAGDIRFNYNAAATATSFPVMPQRYFPVDASANGPTAANPSGGTADTLNFFNTTGSSVIIYIVEVA